MTACFFLSNDNEKMLKKRRDQLSTLSPTDMSSSSERASRRNEPIINKPVVATLVPNHTATGTLPKRKKQFVFDFLTFVKNSTYVTTALALGVFVVLMIIFVVSLFFIPEKLKQITERTDDLLKGISSNVDTIADKTIKTMDTALVTMKNMEDMSERSMNTLDKLDRAQTVDAPSSDTTTSIQQRPDSLPYTSTEYSPA